MIHPQTNPARNLSGNPSRYNQHPPRLAKLKIPPRRLIAHPHRLIDNQDKPTAQVIGLLPDRLLSRRDERRHKHPAICGCIKPKISVMRPGILAVSPMHHHLFTKRTLQELHIAISLIAPLPDPKRIDPPKIPRIKPPHRQPPRILPDIPLHYVKMI